MNSIKTIIELYKASINVSQIKYIVIYGCGSFGVLLSNKMIKSGFKVDYFCDNNPANQGKIVNNIACITPIELQKYTDDALVFVSPKKSDDIYKQLDDSGYQHIFPESLLNIIRFLPEIDNNLYPIGHFYSLYPDFYEIEQITNEIFDLNKQVFDIDFNLEHQIYILNEMMELYSSGTVKNFSQISLQSPAK